MTIAYWLLIAVGVLVLFGVGQRVLDKLRLTDKQALLFIALILILGFVPDIPLGSAVSINLGGALVPLALCIYLFVKAGTTKERVRCAVATILTAGAVYALGRWFPSEPDTMPFDINYLYGLVAGVIAYIFGRSRRGAFVAGVLGMLLADTANAIVIWSQGVDQRLVLGGAGALDAVVISGLLAVLLAELIGEVIERASRKSGRPGREFKNGEFVEKEHE